MDPGLGVHSLKTLNVLPHVPQPDRVDGGNPDVSNADAFFAANRFLQLPIFGQDPPAALIESFPCLRELQRPRKANKKLHPEPLFQLRHDLAHRRLGTAVGRCRLREAAVAGHDTEHFQRFDLHGSECIMGFPNIKSAEYQQY